MVRIAMPSRSYSPLWIALAFFPITPLALAEVPTDLEPEYSEAVLEYNGKRYARAVRLLNQLLKQSPKTIEFLELKALILKTAKKDGASAKTYKSIIRLKRSEGKKLTEVAPYFFELGALFYRNQRLDQAQQAFERALQGGFNPGASKFFLGTIHFKKNHWDKAQKYFGEVLESEANPLKPASHFYLAQAYFKTKNTALGIQNLKDAQAKAKVTLDDPNASADTKRIAKQIYDSSGKAMEPLSRTIYFGNVALITAFDNNVLSVPDSSLERDSTGKRSVKETIQFGLGLMTSPTNTFQWVPNYRLSYNYNLNRDLKTAEYLTQGISLFVTMDPLFKRSYGLKIDGTFIMKNESNGTGDSASLEKYSFTTTAGPFMKIQLQKKMILGFEAFLNQVKNFTDDTQSSDSLKRSGPGGKLRSFWQYDKGTPYLNPNVSLGLSFQNTDGTEYQSRELALGLSNTFLVIPNQKITVSLDLKQTEYPDRTPIVREDSYRSIRISTTRKIAKKLTLLGDISFTNNDSNIDSTYQYKKFQISVGASYSIF